MSRRAMLLRSLKEPVYLGDGLYAEHDGYHVKLWTERENGKHWVGLEPEVLQALDHYRMQINEIMKELRECEL